MQLQLAAAVVLLLLPSLPQAHQQQGRAQLQLVAAARLLPLLLQLAVQLWPLAAAAAIPWVPRQAQPQELPQAQPQELPQGLPWAQHWVLLLVQLQVQPPAPQQEPQQGL